MQRPSCNGLFGVDAVERYGSVISWIVTFTLNFFTNTEPAPVYCMQFIVI